MPIISKKEFADHCGMNTRALAVYIKRGKVLAEGEEIDSDLPQNALFIQKRSTKKVIHDSKKPPDGPETKPEKAKKEGTLQAGSPKNKKRDKGNSKKGKRSNARKHSNTKHSVDKSVYKQVQHELTPEQIQEKARAAGDVREVFELDKKRKQADLAKSEEELELLRLKRAKSIGDVVPTDVIKTLIVLFSENIKNQYIESAENFLVIISQGKEFSSAEVSKYRSQLVLLVNRAVDGAIDSTKRNLKNIIEASSQKRGVGQHD